MIAVAVYFTHDDYREKSFRRVIIVSSTNSSSSKPIWILKTVFCQLESKISECVIILASLWYIVIYQNSILVTFWKRPPVLQKILLVYCTNTKYVFVLVGYCVLVSRESYYRRAVVTTSLNRLWNSAHELWRFDRWTESVKVDTTK